MSETTRDDPPAGPKNDRRGGNLIQNAVALMLSSGGTAVLGVVFWALAAHLVPAEEVGRASAEIAAMMLLSNLAQLSFTKLFDRFLPISGDRTRKFVTHAYALCTFAALIAAIVYVFAGIGRAYIPSGFGWRALFIISVVLWTVFVLQDSVLTGLRATKWVPVENILFSMAKIALLPVFLVVTMRQDLFLAWTVPVVAATGAVSWYLFRKCIPSHEALNPASENLPRPRELASLAFGQYVQSLVSIFSSSIIVLIVIERLGAVAEARYYVPALISTGGVAVLLWNLVTSFLVEASNEPDQLYKHAVTTIRATLVVLVPSLAIGIAFAPQILKIFGAEYAVHGTTLLRMLLLTLPGTAIVAFYSSLAWLDKRVWLIAGIDLVGTVFFFALMLALIGHFGVLAIGIASLVLSGTQIVIFLPIAIRRFRTIARADREQSERRHATL